MTAKTRIGALQFDRPLKLKFLGSKVTTDAGLLAYRELDETFALREMVQDTLEDSRSSTAPTPLALPPPERLWMPRTGASVGQNAGCLEKSTRTRERQSSTKDLAGRYFGRSEPRNRGCGGENVKITTR